MKRMILAASILATTGAIAQNNDAVLLTINGEPAYRSEFEYIYNKNNSETAIDHKTMDEYMDLFINFKLKVAEAKAHGIDTAASFINELAGYRKQITQPYLTDNEAEEALIKTAYERKKTEVEVEHIAIQCPMNASAADTLAAYNKIAAARQRITTGIAPAGKKNAKAVPEDFSAVAKEVSTDPSVTTNGGYIGWVSVFRFVYAFENAAYNTEVGRISGIFRTPYGYHILKVLNRRPSEEVLTSHIMIFTRQGNDSINTAAKMQIDSLYQRVLAGDDFAELAKKYSNDGGSASQGGALPWFGTGRMVPEFEKAAFAMQKSGEVSKPVQSQYGWHIIKLIDRRGVEDFDKVKDELKRNVTRDERGKEVAASFVGKLKTEYNFAVNTAGLTDFYLLAAQYALSDSAFKAEAALLNKPLMTFADRQRTQADFAAFLAQNAHSTFTIPDKIIDDKFNAFAAKELTAYEDTQLEHKYTDFRNLMQEYHDGIMLFEISLQEVWDKASQDTEGITKFFKEHQSDYTWKEPHYKGRVIYCKNANTQKAAKSIVKRADYDSIDSYLTKRLNDSIMYVKIEKGLYVKGDNKAMDKYAFKTGDFEPSEDYPYVFINGKMLKAPEEYTDERGPVTSAYQEYLEQEWIKALRQKYTVVINREVFDKMKNENQ